MEYINFHFTQICICNLLITMRLTSRLNHLKWKTIATIANVCMASVKLKEKARFFFVEELRHQFFL